MHFRYLNILVLTAFEPEVEQRNKVKFFLCKLFGRLGTQSVMKENLLPRLVHLIAHYQDFDPKDLDSLQEACRYFEYYLDSVLNADNTSFLYSIAGKLKTVEDRFTSVDNSHDAIYILAELFQFLIQERSHSHGWTLNSYPGTIQLPPVLYSPIKDPMVASQVLKKAYLSAEFISKRKKEKSTNRRDIFGPSSSSANEKKKPSEDNTRSRQDTYSDDDDSGSDQEVDKDGFVVPKLVKPAAKRPAISNAEPGRTTRSGRQLRE